MFNDNNIARVLILRKHMIALRPRDQHVWDPRPVPHETEAETKTNYCETETAAETKKWSRDHAGLETLTSLHPAGHCMAIDRTSYLNQLSVLVSFCNTEVKFTTVKTELARIGMYVHCKPKTSPFIFDHPRSSMVCNFGWVSLYVMYVCQTITFESIDLGSSYWYIWLISRE